MTTPVQNRPDVRPTAARSAAATVRNTWRRLTSMRTALILLFLLALAAIPGALFPQRDLNSQAVAAYIASRPTIGPALDALGVFDVFSSAWFTAIYTLLFVSVIGCLLPRVVDHSRALRARPVAVPRNLGRLTLHRGGARGGEPREIADEVRRHLPRWRTEIRTEPGADGAVTVSAEKGYTREAGNLIFHFSLVGVLAAVAIGKIVGYEGSVIVVADNGPGFCNTSPAVYDSFRAGSAVDGTGLDPFCVRVKNFTADYLPNGQAEMFTSDISYQSGADLTTGTWSDYRLKVNSPLRLGNQRVYLTGHGYAPTFTVTFPDGQTRTETIQFRPDDATTFLSSGALRIDPPGGSYTDPDERRRNQIAIEGLFAPTAEFNGALLSSRFPEMTDPAVAIDIYRGDAGLDTGIPQSIFALGTSMIEQGRLVKQDRVNLRPGQFATLDDGTTVRFDGAKEFANLQVGYDPTQKWVLVFATTMMLGLVVSLTIRRRRVFVRIRPTGTGHAEVQMAGLARTDHAGWGPEFDSLADRILPEPTDNAAPPRQNGPEPDAP
ncbi:MAG: cytochrome c biogenesis protein ResB [Rhodococcus sp. (in: high G+C Gram-positive bacteria)]